MTALEVGGSVRVGVGVGLRRVGLRLYDVGVGLYDIGRRLRGVRISLGYVGAGLRSVGASLCVLRAAGVPTPVHALNLLPPSSRGPRYPEASV